MILSQEVRQLHRSMIGRGWVPFDMLASRHYMLLNNNRLRHMI